MSPGPALILLAFCRLEVFAEDTFAGLDPCSIAYARHVEQDGTADQSVLEDVDGADLRAVYRHRLGWFPVEEGTIERDVAECIDVGMPIIVVIDAEVVLGLCRAPDYADRGGDALVRELTGLDRSA
jgi:hypothetical protein